MPTWWDLESPLIWGIILIIIKEVILIGLTEIRSISFFVCHNSLAVILNSGNVVGEKGQKDSKSQWIREFAARLYIPIISEMTSIKSHQYDILSMIWTRMTAMGMPKWTRESLWVFNPTQRTIGTWGSLSRSGIPREGHTNWQSRAKWSTLKQKTLTLRRLNSLYLGVCVCVNLYLRGMNYGYLKSWNCLLMKIFEVGYVLNY